MGTAQETFPLWGGSATVAVTEPDRLAVARAAVDRVIRDVDAACSAYRDDSDLARVNAGSGYAVRVSTTFLDVLQAALRAAELTGGLVDPTAVGRSAGAVRLSPGTEVTRPNDVTAFRTGMEAGRSPRTENTRPNDTAAFGGGMESGQSAGTKDIHPNDGTAFRTGTETGWSAKTEDTRPNNAAAFRTGTETGRSTKTEDTRPNDIAAFRGGTETGRSATADVTRPNDVAAFRGGAEAGRSRLGPGFAVPTGKDWRSIEIIPASTTVSVPRGLTLDFGAVGKAFAADRAAAEASAAAGCGVLVALAGDIAVAGPVPVNGWPVRVADDHRLRPDGSLPPGQDITLRAPGGLATSSLAVRTRRMADGRTVTHIVDPRTGMPVRGPWRTVSVSAGTCVDANTASTAALVRGHGAGGWLARHGLPSRLVHADGWVHTIVGWPDDHSERPGVKVAG
ncbi:FAD:protein FMN transferase [Actinoallomurus sp. CA-150999]|uniref:FAD:protein FMN transferase n=1 Tax=Actinoallomurus sp. CA-150999 TaxID=3239887 RepID=UPI003D8AE21B